MNNHEFVAVANHLWQSTLFAAGAGCLAFILRKNSARVRYFLWLAASLKFLVPFALLSSVGASVSWPDRPINGTPPAFLATVGESVSHVTQIAQQHRMVFAPARDFGEYGAIVPNVIIAIWALGTLMVTVRWIIRWRIVRRALHESTPNQTPFTIPVRSSLSQLEPGVVGVLRPVLLLPHGIEDRLTAEEMHAVLAHEHCHVVWRDNLVVTLHMLVEAVFWFYPPVWWLGARIVSERERACDEQVLAEGHAPASYAEGILKVCEHYLQCRLTCVAGIGSANLCKRIETIMKNRLIKRLSAARKMGLALAAGATIVVPVAAGVFNSANADAETASSGVVVPDYSEVSVQIAPADGTFHPAVSLRIEGAPGGPLEIEFPSFRDFIADAYDVAPAQVIGGELNDEQKYVIKAKGPRALSINWLVIPSGDVFWARERPAIQTILATHFGLVVRQTIKTMDGFALEVGRAGPRIKRNYDVTSSSRRIGSSAWGIDATDMPIRTLAMFLGHTLQIPVFDATDLQGNYDYQVAWKTAASDTSPLPGIIDGALNDELGLRLRARRMAFPAIQVVNLTPPKVVLSPNFKDAEIFEVARAVALATHRTFIIDPRVHGRVTLLNAQPMSPEEFFQVFCQILQAHGFVAVATEGNTVKIIPG